MKPNERAFACVSLMWVGGFAASLLAPEGRYLWEFTIVGAVAGGSLPLMIELLEAMKALRLRNVLRWAFANLKRLTGAVRFLATNNGVPSLPMLLFRNVVFILAFLLMRNCVLSVKDHHAEIVAVFVPVFGLLIAAQLQWKQGWEKARRHK